MTHEDLPAVPEAVRAFLVVCGNAPDVYERLDHFIARLSQDPNWTVSEIKEVHSKIIERLT